MGSLSREGMAILWLELATVMVGSRFTGLFQSDEVDCGIWRGDCFRGMLSKEERGGRGSWFVRGRRGLEAEVGWSKAEE